MLFTTKEVIDILIMAGVVGYIFKDLLSPNKIFQKVKGYITLSKDDKWKDFWFSVGIVGLAILLHELGHKFTAISFGLSAQFNAAYIWLLFGLLLKVMNTGFIFFVPAYVSIHGSASPAAYAAIAFAGPGVNLLLWLISMAVGKIYAKNNNVGKTTKLFFFLSARINMFLFILNMLPIPGFDGFTVYSNLFKIFF